MPNFTVRKIPTDWKSEQPALAVKPPQLEQLADSQLPPFEILLDWLAYVHAQTGEWPRPPLKNSSLQDLDKEVVSTKINNNIAASPIKPANKLHLVTAHKQAITTSIEASFYTGFSYVNSSYFKEASRIIDSYAIEPLNNELAFGCKLTLSLIIAWCHFPLFKKISNRQGSWMILATQHCTRELHIRTDTFKHYITELERTGLLVITTAGNRAAINAAEFEQLKSDCAEIESLLGVEATNFWNRRSVQTKTLVYGLSTSIELASDLPTFEPFAKLKNANTYANEKRLAVHSSETERLEKVSQPSKKPFPVYSCYESINHDDVEVSSVATLNFPKMKPEQKLCFDFLDKIACFDGYARSDGRATLDSQQALKIALNANITLVILELVYSQVKEMWSTGQCRKNPLGLFYWAITNNQDPRGFETAQAAPSLKSDPLTSLVNPANQKKGNLNSAKRAVKPPASKISQQKLQKWRLLQLPIIAEISQEPGSVHLESSLPAQQYLTASPALIELWCDIRQIDLAGRFRVNTAQLALLEGSRLEFENNPEAQLIKVLLRSVIEDCQLTAATRQLIQLAIRQRINSVCKLSFGILE